jgi:hypothetical protein
MVTRLSLPALACALLLASGADSADETKTPKPSPEATVRLKLNEIETSKLLDHYGTLVKRELGLRDNVRACIKSNDKRLPEYQKALQDAQDDLDSTKKKLVALERERKKLATPLGKKEQRDAPAEQLEKANRTLSKILERLGSIEKRLEKMEGRK